jgi:hypothetical protein
LVEKKVTLSHKDTSLLCRQISLLRESDMKKLFVSLAVLGFAASLYAQAAPQTTTITAGVNAWVSWQEQDKVNKTNWGDNIAKNFQVRFRPNLTISNGPTKFFLELEMDQLWGADKDSLTQGRTSGAGDTMTTGGSSKFTSPYLPMEGDKQNIEIRQAYMATDIPALPGLNFAAGLIYYNYPVWYGDTVPMAQLKYTAGPVDAKAIFSQYGLGDRTKTNDDAFFYGFDVKYSIEKIASVRPMILFFNTGDNAGSYYPNNGDNTNPGGSGSNGGQYAQPKFRGKGGYVGGLNVMAEVSGIGADVTFMYGAGKDQYRVNSSTKSDTTKITGSAAHAQIYAKINTIKVSLFGDYASGTKQVSDSSGNNKIFNKSFNTLVFDQIQEGSLMIMQDTGKMTINDSNVDGRAINRKNAYGYEIFGVKGEAVLGAVELKAVFGTGGLDVAPSGVNKTITGLGYEADFEVKYLIAPGTKLVIDYAYHSVGKAYKNIKNFVTDGGSTTYASTGAAGTWGANEEAASHTQLIIVSTQYSF